MGNPVLPPLDQEAVEVGVAPTQGDLEGGMKVGDAAFGGDQQAPTDQGTDATEHDPQLVDHRRRRCTGFWHAAIFGATDPGLPRFFPVSYMAELKGTTIRRFVIDRNDPSKVSVEKSVFQGAGRMRDVTPGSDHCLSNVSGGWTSARKSTYAHDRAAATTKYVTSG